jgi:deoxyribonuclease-4
MTSPQLFGCHVSIAGGIDKSIARAEKLQLGAMQIFSKNASRWQSAPLDPQAVERFQDARSRASLGYIAVHDSYLINLASPDPQSWQRSVDAFSDEMERCLTLGIQDLVMHPGAHLESGEAAGLKQIIRAITQAREQVGDGVRILLETTAGQGTNLGWRFEHLAEIMDGCPEADLAVCFDSCHVFAAGYDLRSPQAVKLTLEEFERQIGLDRLALFHLNDSKKGCGSRVDRHQLIGQGEIGEAGFRTLLRDPRLAAIPKIIETPSGPEHRDDLLTLALLRKLSGEEGEA